MRTTVEFKTFAGFWLYVAFMVFLLPLPWFIALIFAASFHELGHILVLKLQRKSIYSVTLGATGAKIITEQLTRRQEFFAAMAGPVAGFIMVFLFPWFPRTAVCALTQSLFNLIPVYPLDGGRMLRSIVGNTP